jgi:hypothetical protein
LEGAVGVLKDAFGALAEAAELGTVKAPGTLAFCVDLVSRTLRDVSLVDLSKQTPGDLEREGNCFSFSTLLVTVWASVEE